jgi:predicted nucleotidyltransferase
MKLKEISNIKSVQAIIEYGSYARGDQNSNSDYDLFILTNGEVPDFLNPTWSKYISKEIGTERFDISIYDRGTFELMIKNGSLFLWHLKLEGNIIYSRSSPDRLFEYLDEFSGADEDLYLYRRLLKSAKESIRKNGINNYDLNMMSLISRNTLIILCYKMKKIQFSKQLVYETVQKYYGEKMSLSKDVYNLLQGYRFLYSRNISVLKPITENEISNILAEIDNLLDDAFKYSNLKNSLDRVSSIIRHKIDRNLYGSYEILTEFERDLYLGIAKLAKREFGVVINGINEPHKRKFEESDKVNICNNDNKYSIIELGFVIYNYLQFVKINTSIYGPNSADVFSQQRINATKRLDETMLDFFSKSMLVNSIKKNQDTFLSKFILMIEGKLDRRLESRANITKFIEKISEFSDAISKYENSI